MPYTLEHRVLPEYLEVHIKAEIVPGKELKEAIERWTKIAALCNEYDRNLILTFIDLDGQLSNYEKFNLVDSASSFGWRPEYKLSLVVKNEEQLIHISFIETVMNNLGYEIKLFLNKREARKWLLT